MASITEGQAALLARMAHGVSVGPLGSLVEYLIPMPKKEAKK